MDKEQVVPVMLSIEEIELLELLISKNYFFLVTNEEYRIHTDILSKKFMVAKKGALNDK